MLSQAARSWGSTAGLPPGESRLCGEWQVAARTTLVNLWPLFACHTRPPQPWPLLLVFFVCFLFLPSDQVLALSLQWPGTCWGSSPFAWTCWSGSHCPLWGADLQLWHLMKPCAPEVAPGLTYQPRTRTGSQNTDHWAVRMYSHKTGVRTSQPHLDLWLPSQVLNLNF